MINIQDSRVIKYDGDRKSVTVYRDFDNANLWYIVPTPQLATQTVGGETLPAFALTEFKANSGSAGVATFTVELVIDTAAYQAVKAALGPNIEFGQFAWNDAQAYLTLSLSSGKGSFEINVTPSNYGGNSATFVIDLKTSDEVNYVRSVFAGGTGLSTWSIQYVVSTLSKLPAVVATVTYDSSIAATYEKTVEISRNVWGSETGRRVTVREQLKKSDAGKVDLNWSVQPSPEFEQRVHDWAFTTLEGLVEAAADAVARQLGQNTADNFSISSVGSFKRVYSENQVIDWTITPQAFLPTFTQDVWSKLYKLVDNRRLTVAVTMLDDLKTAGIRQVDVTIRYPGKAGATTQPFTPNGKTTWTYDSDGAFIDGKFIDEYEYSYTVYFENGKNFPSDYIPSNTTGLNLTFTDFGYQQARFVGANITFGSKPQDVAFVLIDFTYKPNGESKLYVDQQRLDENGVEVVFASHSYLPSDAAYNYALTFVLNDNTFLVTTPRTVFAPSNRGLVQLLNVVAPAEFSIFVQNDTDAKGNVTLPAITGLVLNGLYTDQQTPGSKQTHSFNDLKISDSYFGLWDYTGSTESATSTVQIDGTVVYRDVGNTSRQVQLRAVRYNPQLGSTLLLLPVELPFTVTFDPSLVDWDTYSLVTVDVFRSKQTLTINDPRAVPEDAKTDIQTISFQRLDTEQGEKILPFPYYYTFTRQVGTSSQFYYSAVYYERKSGLPHHLAESAYDSTTVLLPRQVTGTTRQLLTATLADDDLVATDADVELLPV